MKKKLLLSFTLTTGLASTISPISPNVSHTKTVQAAKSTDDVQCKPFSLPAKMSGTKSR